MQNIKVKYGSKSIVLRVKETGFFTKGIGLMFRTRLTKNLVFYFDKSVRLSITSFFVFFPFLAVWLDKNRKVVHKEIVSPFRFAIKPKNSFCTLVEVPINENNSKILEFFVGKKETFKYLRR